MISGKLRVLFCQTNSNKVYRRPPPAGPAPCPAASLTWLPVRREIHDDINKVARAWPPRACLSTTAHTAIDARDTDAQADCIGAVCDAYEGCIWAKEVRACMVRMSKRPRNSFSDTSSPKMVRYMSAEVPEYLRQRN